MKNLLKAVVLLVIAASLGMAQGYQPLPGPSFASGVYYAPDYNFHQEVYTGSTLTSSSYTITVFAPTITLRDGRVVSVYSTSNPITIGSGANQETVTPSAVAGCGVGQPYRGCMITATFTYAHGKGDIITSGTNGWAEAVTDAASHGGGTVYWEQDCGSVTLSTSGATTTTTCNVPKTQTTLGASVYVNTTVTTAASYSLGISGHTTTFMSSCTSLTAGTNCSQFVPAPTALAAGTGTGAVLVTANATAGAGVIHVKLWGYTMAQSSY